VFQIDLLNERMNQHMSILECVVCSAYCVLPGDPVRINTELSEECISCNIQFTYNVALILKNVHRRRQPGQHVLPHSK